ncbi:GSCOCG00010931001-RA-CDS [Cotesia congregata]|nr:GSCOCG00010931001-RA-CDS [Cotesia congregata]
MQSCINSPCYNLARHLHRLLIPLIDTFEMNVKNSSSLVNKLSSVILPAGYILVSLDVVSLFTMIPKDLVMEIISVKWDDFKELLELPKEVILKMISICFDTSYFTFKKEVYLQLDGTSMGNPASPSLANIVMYYVWTNVISSLPFAVPPLYLYVDDTLLAVPENEKDNLLLYFNRFHANIQFTLECEKAGQIPFLDMVVMRTEDGRI